MGDMIPSRRRFLLGAGTFLAAPAIVRVASLMSLSVAPYAPAPSGIFCGNGRPDLSAAPGSFYFRTDVDGGSVYIATGKGWEQLGTNAQA